MSNNTATKALITNLENSDKRRLTNAVHDLFLVTEGYSPKVFTPSPNVDVEEGTLVDIKTLIMIIEDAAALSQSCAHHVNLPTTTTNFN